MDRPASERWDQTVEVELEHSSLPVSTIGALTFNRNYLYLMVCLNGTRPYGTHSEDGTHGNTCRKRTPIEAVCSAGEIQRPQTKTNVMTVGGEMLSTGTPD